MIRSETWTQEFATLVMDVIVRHLQTHGSCSVMLTGGRSAEQLYKTWSRLPGFSRFRNVHYFFGDERCVPPTHIESNYGLAIRTLFQRGVPNSCKVIRMPAEWPDAVAAANAYEARLPEKIDVLLLSVGEDGHIASLFPFSPALLEKRRRVLPVRAPKPPIERLTVTPRVISQAKDVFVMALGQTKMDLYKQAWSNPQDISILPARLVLNATWFFDNRITQ